MLFISPVRQRHARDSNFSGFGQSPITTRSMRQVHQEPGVADPRVVPPGDSLAQSSRHASGANRQELPPNLTATRQSDGHVYPGRNASHKRSFSDVEKGEQEKGEQDMRKRQMLGPPEPPEGQPSSSSTSNIRRPGSGDAQEISDLRARNAHLERENRRLRELQAAWEARHAEYKQLLERSLDTELKLHRAQEREIMLRSELEAASVQRQEAERAAAAREQWAQATMIPALADVCKTLQSLSMAAPESSPTR